MDIITSSPELNKYFVESILHDECELEVIYGVHPKNNPLTKETFINLKRSNNIN